MRLGLTGILSALLLLGSPALAAEHTEAGLRFEAPDDAEVQVRDGGDLPEGVALVTITHGEEAVALTVYTGDARPTPRRARGVHQEEIERRALRDGDRFETEKLRHRFLRRPRHAREVRWETDGGAWIARVVAARRGDRTVVATWVRPRDVDDPASDGLVSSVRVE